MFDNDRGVQVNSGGNYYAGGELVRSINSFARDDLVFREGLNNTVPEPSSWALAGLALLGLSTRRRRTAR